jgi:hypothetical protein
MKTVAVFLIMLSVQISNAYSNNTPSPFREGKGGVMYPNPAGDFIMYKTDISENENATLIIYNMLGEAMHTEKINVQQQEGRIDLSTFVSGMYLYRVYINNAPVRAGPFVISK